MPTLGNKNRIPVTLAMRDQLEQLCDLDSSEVRISEKDLEFIDSLTRQVEKKERATISAKQADWLRSCVERYLEE